MQRDAQTLITGATGFVGSAVAKALRDAGFLVRALVRPGSPRAHIAGLGLELVEGDLRDRASVARAMHGVRYVFHVAADYRLWARVPNEIVTANIEGTRVAMEAAARAGAERIIYTSSVATLAPAKSGPSDERAALAESEAIGAYKRSKVAAERLVEAMIGRGLPAVIVNPSTPIGPRDGRPTPTGRIVMEAARGRMPAYVDTGLNLVHVNDVAQGHIAALRSGRIGERYILGGDDVTLGQMLADIARLVGRAPPRVKLPRAPLFPLAYLTEVVAQITGKEPFLTLDGLRMAKHKMFFSSAKAERELGYKYRPYPEAIKDALEWFRAKRMLD